jgi:hypothetical protein
MKIEIYETILVPEYVPNTLEEGKLYTVYGTKVAEEIDPSVSYLCPCGCKGYTYLPCYLPGKTPRSRPSWEIILNTDNTITLSPSILDLGRCKSHYFIKNNKVEWC